MSKVAVVYWSGTGNTEAMASAVADGIKEKGGEAVVLTSAEFDKKDIRTDVLFIWRNSAHRFEPSQCNSPGGCCRRLGR